MYDSHTCFSFLVARLSNKIKHSLLCPIAQFLKCLETAYTTEIIRHVKFAQRGVFVISAMGQIPTEFSASWDSSGCLQIPQYPVLKCLKSRINTVRSVILQ